MPQPHVPRAPRLPPSPLLASPLQNSLSLSPLPSPRTGATNPLISLSLALCPAAACCRRARLSVTGASKPASPAGVRAGRGCVFWEAGRVFLLASPPEGTPPDGLWGRWVRPGLLVRAPRFRWLVSKIELLELYVGTNKQTNAAHPVKIYIFIRGLGRAAVRGLERLWPTRARARGQRQ